MPSVQTVKLVAAAIGMMVFFLGVRLEESVVRWTGIGLVAVALGLRFVRRRP